MKTLLFQLACFALIGYAGATHFDPVTGAAMSAAVYLLMPWQYAR